MHLPQEICFVAVGVVGGVATFNYNSFRDRFKWLGKWFNC